MLVADLQHFLDLGPDTPGPARKLAEHLTGIVAAASAGDAHTLWETALPCPRRPGNRRCPGRISVVCPQSDQPIGWRCSHCGDDGTISNWAGSIYDLRRQHLTATRPHRDIIVDAETAAVLRTLPFLDNDCQRAVFAIRADDDALHLVLTDTELDDLIDALAAESNHELNLRRQRRLDSAYDALIAATDQPRWPYPSSISYECNDGALQGFPSMRATRCASNARSQRGT